jgi:hypothetical protein
MRKLYRFHWNVRRMGEVEGVFIADEDTIQANLGKDVYFGEILGKHSEICGYLGAEDLTVLSDDQEFIDRIEQVFGGTSLSGYCPLDYLSENDE